MNKRAKQLAGFVNETVDTSLVGAPPLCPYGCDGLAKIHNTETTLIGGGPPDPNHVWKSCSCPNCNRKFIRESKDCEVWYTTDRKPHARILRGFPNCFEGYTYTHMDCGGDVLRRHTALDGCSEPERLGVQIGGPDAGKKIYRTFYRCEKCGEQREVDEW